MAAMQFLVGQDRASLQLCFANWRSWSRESSLQKGAREATQMAMRKFLRGNEAGLVETVFACWRKEFSRKKTGGCVMMAMAKALAGEQKALLQGAFSSWRSLAVTNRTVRDMDQARAQEVAENASRRDAERKEALAAQRQQMLQVTATAFGGRCGTLRTNSAFQAWKAEYARSCGIARRKTATLKAGEYLVLMRARGDDRLLLSIYLHEMIRACKIASHKRDREGMRSQLGEASALLDQTEEERTSLQEELWSAYKQIDQITETLQQELKTKEELATELREAYSNMRRRNVPPSPSPTQISFAGGDNLRAGRVGMKRYSSSPSIKRFGEGTPSRPNDASTMRKPPDLSSLEVFDPKAALSGLGTCSFYQDEIDDSAGTCTWREAVKKMKAEGLIHEADGSSGIM
jgi:hypothetical protein